MALAAWPFTLYGTERGIVGGKDSFEGIPARYAISTPRGIRCQLCPNKCTIKEGERGDCRTRINRNGELITLAYGNPCAVHIDPIEKKPLNHFLPGTTSFSIATGGCNLACLNCQNWQISQKAPDEVGAVDMMPGSVVSAAKAQGCPSIAYTYTEPIVFYEYTNDTAKIAHEKGLRNVIVSAGYIGERPLREWCKNIDAANIDLKSFSDEIYQRLNAGSLQPVLNTLKVLKEEGVWLEITNLIVPQWTDDTEMIKRMCGWLVDNGFEDNPLHFSRFTPMYKLNRLPATPPEILEKAHEIAREAGMKYVYIGNVPGHEAQDTYCPACRKKIIDRSGFRIRENHIVDGHCGFCGEPIAGVWK
ncbi:AmmeMemoRadiSam system radical SAM enzyme [Anaerophaga thermohalophila]|uniref:AmmeMemoRadiSam system radical SAM enzyme n=1 Tax=Anaerophaga thermohalophila TaxID=177400 RepID=UPI000237D1BF|nr:AmmeMemoRadiSam system radical SAM enzyme [Anaerophaga thermohalophila]